MDLDRWATQAKTEQAQAASNTEAATPPDVLTSKLLIGEFVILSQNYTNSPAQKSLLSENIVKLVGIFSSLCLDSNLGVILVQHHSNPKLFPNRTDGSSVSFD